MDDKILSISIIGRPSMNLRHFIFQFCSILAKSIEIVDNIERNGVLLELSGNFIPEALQVQEDLDYVECPSFMMIDRASDEKLLNQLGIRRNLDYIVSDYISEDSDIVFYVVEQNLDSAAFINEAIEEANAIKENKIAHFSERAVFLDFLDIKYSPEYFLEFRLNMGEEIAPKYYIDFDEDDIKLGMGIDLDADFNINKLSNQRLHTILDMYAQILNISDIKAHVKQLKKNEKINRRKRKC